MRLFCRFACCLVPCLSTSVLRALARAAGVHLYTDRPAVVYANRSFLSVSVDQPGEYTLHLPETARVVDALSRVPIARQNDAWHIHCDARQTRLFMLKP